MSQFIEKNLSNPKCYGIGECGLDYNRMFSPKKNNWKCLDYRLI